jgi:hypothetical protein
MTMLKFAFESLAVTEHVVPPFPREVLIKALQNAAAFLNSSTITGVGDALCAPSYLSAYLEPAVRGLLILRINMIVPHIFLQHFEKAERMLAHKSFLNAGVIPAAASDHPVGLHSALPGVQCMVTRKSPTGWPIWLCRTRTDQIGNIGVDMTIVNGQIVYDVESA